MRQLRALTISLALLAATMTVHADDGIQCHKIVIAGDSQWPPYTIVVAGHEKGDSHDVQLKGLGIDLARKIFTELDVPVEEFAYSDTAQMMQGLRDGEIDIIVSTYNTSGIAHDVMLIQPAYIIDPVTVAVPSDMSGKIKNWESLHGLHGIKSVAFVADDQTADYISKHLIVQNQDSLLPALQSVINGTNKFMIGSDLQLSYAIKNNHLAPSLIVMKNLVKDGDVFMAFSKKSACKQYAIYVQKRLQDYKNNGTVEKVLKKYAY